MAEDYRLEAYRRAGLGAGLGLGNSFVPTPTPTPTPFTYDDASDSAAYPTPTPTPTPSPTPSIALTPYPTPTPDATNEAVGRAIAATALQSATPAPPVSADPITVPRDTSTPATIPVDGPNARMDAAEAAYEADPAAWERARMDAAPTSGELRYKLPNGEWRSYNVGANRADVTGDSGFDATRQDRAFGQERTTPSGAGGVSYPAGQTEADAERVSRNSGHELDDATERANIAQESYRRSLNDRLAADPAFLIDRKAKADADIAAARAGARTSSRPVGTSDAGKIAAFDTGINDLNKLHATLSGNNATGAMAQAGAATPDWLTALTGIGTDAKKRQATIDLVKQVIGKTLEGGVLRREDEIKYEKILPTIKDTPAVAASKLEGLYETLKQQRETHLNALNDAGYNVDRYNARPVPAFGANAEDAASAAPRRVTSDAEHAALPPGSTYVGPDGKLRRKR